LLSREAWKSAHDADIARRGKQITPFGFIFIFIGGLTLTPWSATTVRQHHSSRVRLRANNTRCHELEPGSSGGRTRESGVSAGADRHGRQQQRRR
jgi:hypothetical protein